jgi:hypothetical protein
MIMNAVNERRLKRVVAGSGARINRVRNQLIKDFLAGPTEWMWMVDTDMDIPHDALTTLLHTAEKNGRKCVGALGYIWNPEHDPPIMASIVYTNEDDDTYVYNRPPPLDTLVEADSTGFFCLLVHRSVLEKMGEFYAGLNMPWINEPDLGADKAIGPDMEFFRRMKEATGVTPLITTHVACDHLKRVSISHANAVSYYEGGSK